jgi:hypothetical protein
MSKTTNMIAFIDDHRAVYGVADDPEIQFAPFPVCGRDFDKARQTSLFFDGSIDAP